MGTGIIDLIMDVLIVAAIVFFAMRRTKTNDESTSPAELAGRTVLIGTFSVTMYLFLRLSNLRSDASFPDIPEGILTLNALATGVYFIILFFANIDSGRDSKLRLAQARKEASENPDDLRYAWKLASASLETYLDRNVSQIKWIFNISVMVMICGFAMVGYGVNLSLSGKVNASIATSASGILTQFIGATFMFIYRSTMDQASSYVTLIERINNIGMAMQIVEKMSGQSTELKDNLQAETVRALIANQELRTGHLRPAKSGSQPPRQVRRRNSETVGRIQRHVPDKEESNVEI